MLRSDIVKFGPLISDHKSRHVLSLSLSPSLLQENGWFFSIGVKGLPHEIFRAFFCSKKKERGTVCLDYSVRRPFHWRRNLNMSLLSWEWKECSLIKKLFILNPRRCNLYITPPPHSAYVGTERVKVSSSLNRYIKKTVAWLCREPSVSLSLSIRYGMSQIWRGDGGGGSR
jgi:hypothetical protein